MRKPWNIRQGLTGGLVIALVASVGVGASAESFWAPFLTALAFSLLCAGGVTWLLVVANRRRPSR